MKITMYTQTECPNCKRAKFMFKYCPVVITLIEKNIEKNKEWKRELEQDVQSYTLPTFVFENGTVIRGFNEGQIRNELGL